MRGVQFEHEDGEFNSPRFDTGDLMQCKIVVERDVLRSTTAVSACCRETQHDSIKSLSFMDKTGAELCEVNHYQREIGVALQVYHLGEDEEIIGGYGVSNRQKFITSFGFTVLKRGAVV